MQSMHRAWTAKAVFNEINRRRCIEAEPQHAHVGRQNQLDARADCLLERVDPRLGALEQAPQVGIACTVCVTEGLRRRPLTQAQSRLPDKPQTVHLRPRKAAPPSPSRATTSALVQLGTTLQALGAQLVNSVVDCAV